MSAFLFQNELMQQERRHPPTHSPFRVRQASQAVMNTKIEDLNDAIDRVSAQIEATSAEQELPLVGES